MNKLAKFSTALAGGLVASLYMIGAAYATSDLDGVGTAATSAKSDMVTFVTGTLLPILFGLTVLGIGIRLAVKYVRRGARAA